MIKDFFKKIFIFIKNNILKVSVWLLLLRHISITSGAVIISAGMLLSPSGGYIPNFPMLFELKERYSPLRLLIPAAILTVVSAIAAKKGIIKYRRVGKAFTSILWVLSVIGCFAIDMAIDMLLSV
ncbi:MAG: hypothetical protein IJ062_08190 [Firmicutes bacterium]|nr:hypothetical protein [Bacillota bacterium]